MTTVIEQVWKQALKTFAGRGRGSHELCWKSFEKLQKLVNELKADDIKLDKQLLKFIESQETPMFVMNVFENADITIAVFILNHGFTMPMHDHPEMYGLLKVLTGSVNIDSYTLDSTGDSCLRPDVPLIATRHDPITVAEVDEACVLKPHEGNLHEISCVEGPAAFLDILSPPYDFGKRNRPCTLFKVLEPIEQSAKVKLIVTEEPTDFTSKTLTYRGPPLE